MSSGSCGSAFCLHDLHHQQTKNIMVLVANTNTPPTVSNTDSKIIRMEVDFPGLVGGLPIFSSSLGVFRVEPVGVVVVMELESVGVIGVVKLESVGVVGVVGV